MTAIISTGKRGRKAEVVTVKGLRFVHLTLPRGGFFARFAARRAARSLGTKNIEKAIFVKEFPYTEIFAKYGVFSCDIRPLRMAVAPQLVRLLLEKDGVSAREAFVAVRSGRMSAEVKTLVTSLGGVVRYLALDAPDREALAEQLRFHHGVVLREGESGAQLILSLLEGERCGGKVLALFDEALRISYACDAQWEGVETEELLAALLAEGGIATEKIALLGADASNLLTREEKNSIMLCT